MNQQSRNTLAARQFRAKNPTYYRDYYRKQRKSSVVAWIMFTQKELDLIERTIPIPKSRSWHIANVLKHALNDFEQQPFQLHAERAEYGRAEHRQGASKIRTYTTISRKLNDQLLALKKDGQSKTGIIRELVINWLNKKDSRSNGERESKSQLPPTHHTGGKNDVDVNKAMNN